MEKERQNYIRKAFEEIQIFLNEGQIQQFASYYEILIQKNEVMNLTAITEFEDVVRKHFVDSLTIKNLLEPKAGEYWLDLGTGAGFPGIPLKIVYPELKLVLLDSLNKRVKFLQEVIEKLDLKKIDAVHGRAEELARKAEYREQFDCCVSRAVANLASLSEYCLPFVKPGGCFVPYKSEKIQEEIKGAERQSVFSEERWKSRKSFFCRDRIFTDVCSAFERFRKHQRSIREKQGHRQRSQSGKKEQMN